MFFLLASLKCRCLQSNVEAANCTKYPYLGNISEIIYLVHHIVQVPLDLRTRGTMWRIIRRKWQPTPVFLPGESQGGLPSMGSHRVGHDWSDLAVTVAADHILGFKVIGCTYFSGVWKPLINRIVVEFRLHTCSASWQLPGSQPGLCGG